MREARWRGVVTFYADTPTDDAAADDYADTLSDGLADAVALIPGVLTGSVRVDDLDEIGEDA